MERTTMLLLWVALPDASRVTSRTTCLVSLRLSSALYPTPFNRERPYPVTDYMNLSVDPLDICIATLRKRVMLPFMAHFRDAGNAQA